MRTALVELVRGKEWRGRDKVAEWIRLLEGWNFEEIVFLGDDVSIHPEFWEIYDHAAKDLRVEHIRPMTNGQWMTQEDINEWTHRSALEPIIPLDFHEPISGRVYGENDYNQMTERMLQRLRGASVWHGVTQNNLRNVQQIAGMAMQMGIDWRGHVWGTESLPDEFWQMVEEEEMDVLDISQWQWAHQDGEIPEQEIYFRDIVRGRAQYTGVIHVDIEGHVRTIHDDTGTDIWRLDRSSLADLSGKMG